MAQVFVQEERLNPGRQAAVLDQPVPSAALPHLQGEQEEEGWTMEVTAGPLLKEHVPPRRQERPVRLPRSDHHNFTSLCQ